MAACDICPPQGAVLIGDKVAPFDAAAAETAALREAVAHGRWQASAPAADAAADQWQMYFGLACYRRWAADFRSGSRQAPMGSQYCYGVVRSTHRCAAEFLREIAPRHPALGADLLEAAGHFEREADILDGGQSLLWWCAPPELTEEHAERAAQVIEAAADEYAAGIDGIARALERPL